ncbi:hypothetical protein ACVWZD_005036 [Streptomyces sp. TE3672]|nr:hypothetical protein EES42_24915 [Streptomyces sp. ADI95-17]
MIPDTAPIARMSSMKTAAYTAINTLVLTAHSLPQTLEQISQQLHELQAAGQVVSTDGAHTTDGQLASTHGALRRAGEHAAALADALHDARVAVSGLVMVDAAPAGTLQPDGQS